MHWQDVALGYFSYLALVSLTRQEFAPARLPLLVAAAIGWMCFALVGEAPLSATLEVVVPALALLAGYWMSGRLFVRHDVGIERWLRSVDDAILTRSGVLPWFRQAPGLIAEYFELSYLLVYVAVPAGATVLALAGHADRIDRFWTVVLLAEFACYGMLPWIQTRPPRILEADVGGGWGLTPPASRTRPIQQFNRRIADRASIRANTIPSGHAAGALATALAVGSSMPVAGVVFAVLAISIAVATVLGRYHYVIDTVLGVAVAVASWVLVGG
jgi:membrane-associated phospholipid phosphatase